MSQTPAPTVAIVVTAYDEPPELLREALASARAQTAPASEIIVVDDGSPRHVAAVAADVPGVRVIRQKNQGLAAARNTGWRAARASHVVFLDADDRLLPEALAANLRRFAATPEAGMAYGAYRFVDRDGRATRPGAFVAIGPDPYARMLAGNCIGMHATVMYRRAALDALGGFDPRLRACEDYELYLRLARRFPVVCGPEPLAEYRRHDGNMSNDLPMMRRTALAVLARHAPGRDDPAPWHAAYAAGVRGWKWHYAYDQLAVTVEALRGRRFARLRLLDLARIGLASPIVMAQVIRSGLPHVLPRRPVSFGGLRRTTPVSRHFGYDRGTPIDRRYIEEFLARHAADVRGRVLEVGDDAYTRAFGGDRVTRRDVLHVDPNAPNVTYVADLAAGDGLPSDAFDCVVLTQTLHLVFDLPAAVATLHRILKPGGVLLLTVPGVSSVDAGEWGDAWLWSLTPASLGRLLRLRFAPADVAVECRGNVLTAVAFLHGFAADELGDEEFAVRDPQYPVIVAARARKAVA